MLRSTFSSLREYLTPVSHTSNFQNTGQLTPEEFVKAGDYLVYKFPTWSWSAASSKAKTRDFLPADKQYLVTKHVPCYERATTDVSQNLQLVEGGDDDTWLVGGDNDTGKQDYEGADSTKHTNNNDDNDNDDAPVDLDELEALGIQEDGEEDADNTGEPSQARSYNVYITYSTSYRVPKAYLSGFDADGAPLKPKLMFDDIVGDYKDKTVTIESAPFQDNLTLISIHPCRHAGVMRMLLDMADQRAIAETNNTADEWEEVPQGLRVDQYLVVFLKFIASVTPTIEYDFTMSAL